MKRGLILSGIFAGILAVLSVGLVSAYYSGEVSLGALFDAVDPSTMTLGILFVILFAVINFALSKTFKGNATVSTIVSAAFSLLAVYGIYRSGYDYTDLFYGVVNFVGIPQEIIYTLLPFIVLGLIIFLGFALRNFGISFLLVGFVLLLAGLIKGIVYARGLVAIIGIAFIVVGIYILVRRVRKSGYLHASIGR